jgi:hypothetical protein
MDVGAQAERQLTDTIAAMRELLRPVGEAQEFLKNLQEGGLKDAADRIRDWVTQADAASRLAGNVANEVVNGLTAVVSQVGQALSLSSDVTQQLNNAVETVVRNAAAEISGQITSDQAVDLLSESIKFLQTQTPTLIVEWARTQVGTLADQGVDKLVESFKTQVRPQLTELGLDEAQQGQLQARLAERLRSVEAGALRSMDTYLKALQDLLAQVEERRESRHSPLRKALYWILNKLGVKDYKELYAPKRDRQVPTLKAETTAGWIMKRTDQQRDEEASRVRWLRFISVIVGIGLAYLLTIDSANLLPVQLGALSSALSHPVGDYVKLSTTAPIIGPVGRFLNQLTLGMIVSGLAAAAGSTFWHDQLDRLQVTKKVVGQISEMTSQARQSGAGES